MTRILVLGHKKDNDDWQQIVMLVVFKDLRSSLNCENVV